jgi:hypothetical protein
MDDLEFLAEPGITPLTAGYEGQKRASIRDDRGPLIPVVRVARGAAS